MSDVAVSSTLVEDLLAKGSISAEDVLRLRRGTYADGVVQQHEADAVFRLDRECGEKDASWTAFYVDALTDYFVWQSQPRSYVSAEQSRYLIDQILHDGHIDSASELELLLNIVHWAQSCPEELPLFALRAVRESILEPGTAAYGSNRPPAVIAPSDVEIVRKVIYGHGSPGGFTVTREEAELMFELNDATSDEDNAPGWPDLFAKAVANYLMFPRGAPVVADASEVIRRERWLKERRGIGGFLTDMFKATARGDIDVKGAAEAVDPFGSAAARKEREAEEARVCEALSREAIDAQEAAWLSSRVTKDGTLSEGERKLLQFIKQNSPSIDPSLDPLFAKAGI